MRKEADRGWGGGEGQIREEWAGDKGASGESRVRKLSSSSGAQET